MSRDPVVVVPGDLDVEDRIAGPVTFRMAAWLATAAGGVALVATARGAVAPTALGVVLVMVGVTGAWWRPGGRPAAAWVGPLLAYRRRSRAGSDLPAAGAQPAPEPVAEAMPDEATPDVPAVRRRPRLVGAAVAAVVVLALAGVAGSRVGHGREKSPVAVVSTPQPDPPSQPVVVVVPVDPFIGWEVGGDVLDPLCGC